MAKKRRRGGRSRAEPQQVTYLDEPIVPEAFYPRRALRSRLNGITKETLTNWEEQGLIKRKHGDLVGYMGQDVIDFICGDVDKNEAAPDSIRRKAR